MKTEILTALQFISALQKEQGIEVAPTDVKIGRLEINSAEKKETGYVCFYTERNGLIYWIKAFKGETERVTSCGTEGQEVKVLKEYSPVCSFKSAYRNATWRVNFGSEGIFLTVGK